MDASDHEHQQPCPDPNDSGLYIETRSGEQVRVQCSSCAFQIGETAQIQSGGLLQATPHAVLMASNKAMTRESFALFLEPNFDTPLDVPAGRSASEVDSEGGTLLPISARWKPGGTFGDFHWNTIRAFAVKK